MLLRGLELRSRWYWGRLVYGWLGCRSMILHGWLGVMLWWCFRGRTVTDRFRYTSWWLRRCRILMRWCRFMALPRRCRVLFG